MKTGRQRHFGELAVDLGIVIGSLLYLRAAANYPAEGRQIPDVVGYLALGLGLLHLVAHVVPALWKLTHGNPEAGRSKAPAVPAQAGAARTAAVEPAVPAAPTGSGEGTDVPEAAEPAPVTLDVAPGEPRQVLIAMAWVVGLLLGTYLVGYVVAIPVFFLAYFGVLRMWRTAVVSAVVMAVVAQGLFVTALAVPLPHGLLL